VSSRTAATVVPTATQLGNAKVNCTEQVGVDVEQQNYQAYIRRSLLVTFANMLGVEDSEPRPEHQQTTRERQQMNGLEEVRMPPASASIGNVRIPPGRFFAAWAKKSSNARPRKKLSPKSRPKFAAEGAAFIGSHLARFWSELKRGQASCAGNRPAATLIDSRLD
jgi:hypothetical protein